MANSGWTKKKCGLEFAQWMAIASVDTPHPVWHSESHQNRNGEKIGFTQVTGHEEMAISNITYLQTPETN